MKHAATQLGEYTIPVVFAPPTSVTEKCDRCRKVFLVQEIMLVGQEFLCQRCGKRNGSIQRRFIRGAGVDF